MQTNTSLSFGSFTPAQLRSALLAGAVPALLFLLLKGLYLLTGASTLSTVLSPICLPFLFLAGVCMYLLLQRSSIIHLADHRFVYLFTTCYGFCSFTLLQETSIASLLLYAIFPLLFLCFEELLVHEQSIPFVIACAIMLCIQPEAGIEIALLLFVLAILYHVCHRTCSLGNFLHVLVLFLFSFGLAAARIIYYLAPYLADHSDYAYEGFSLSYHPLLLLGRFLPGVTASRALAGTTNRMDLYFGLFPLLCMFLFFLRRTISLRQKFFHAAFTLLLVGVLECSPLLYVFNLFHITYHSTLAADFFLIFWLLYTAALACSGVETLFPSEITGATVLTFLTIAAAWAGGAHNFLWAWLPVQITLLVVYACLLGAKKSHSWIFACLLILCLTELTGAGYLSSNADLLPTSASTQVSFDWLPSDATSTEETTTSTNETSASTDKTGDSAESGNDTNTTTRNSQENDSPEGAGTKDYDSFVTKHQDTEMEENLNTLYSLISLTTEEKEKYCGTPFPDYFQTFNGLCKKAGISGTLFSACDYTIEFADSKEYDIVDEGYHIYNVSSKDGSALSDCIAPFTIQLSGQKKGTYYQYDNVTPHLLRANAAILSGKKNSYVSLITAENRSTNFQILLYRCNDTVYQNVVAYLEKHQENSDITEVSYLTYDYTGIGISLLFLCILTILCLYDGRHALHQTLASFKSHCNAWTPAQKIGHQLYRKRIYLLSFLLPFLCFLVAMLICDATPFGENSMFDSDGTISSIPAFLDQYYKYENSNSYLSLNLGYGSDLSLSCSISLLSLLYHFLPLSAIVPMMEGLLGVSLGLCGLTMSIYLTHRCHRTAANPEDLRLLIPAMVYALNAYILAVHNYPTWYLVLFLFPLVMLSMDHMLLRENWLPYTLLLGICILTEIQLTLFICIYLVIHFFTYHFENFRDFFCKGIRFTWTSLLGGGCGFLIVLRTLTAYQTSGYTDQDSIFPSLGLHTSFWDQWKKLLLFIPTDAVSTDNGNVSLYCGISTLILVLLYFLYHRDRFTDKLRVLFPILILSISFNGQVLSYLWNGMHYQANCPNRYVFLLIFLFSELSYEALSFLPSLSIRAFTSVYFLLLIFFIACHACGSNIPDGSFATTLLCLSLYFLLHCVYKHSSFAHYIAMFALISFVELAANMIYSTSTWSTQSITGIYGDYIAKNNLINRSTTMHSQFSRSIYVGRRLYNQGQYYNTACINGFGTCINLTQLYLHRQYAFNATSNSMSTPNTSTPLNLSLASCKYIYLPVATEHIICDLEDYQYIGLYDNPELFTVLR